MSEFLWLSTLALLFWFTQKLTDAHHEHWLNFFPFAKIFFWFVAWIITFILISYDEVLLVTYLSLLLYWLFLLKVDNHGHMITAIFMLFWALFYWNTHWNFPIFQILNMFLWYLLLNFVRKDLQVNCLAWSRMATWKSPTRGRVKIPHPGVGRTEFYLVVFLF